MKDHMQNAKGENTSGQHDEAVERGKAAIDASNQLNGSEDQKEQQEKEEKDAENWRNEG